MFSEGDKARVSLDIKFSLFKQASDKGNCGVAVGDKFHSTRSKEKIDIQQLLQRNQVLVISVNSD
jgi:hypothetical protein